MATMNVFTQNPDSFGMTELTGYVQNAPFNPQMLGSMNLFTPKPVRQKNVFIDERNGTLNLIGFSERGSAPKQHERYSRRAINLTIPRIAEQDKIWAHEIAGLRESGTETELMAVQREVSDRLDAMRQDVEYTEEYLRLAAIQGLVLDPADGSTYYNYFTEFNITPATTVSFELDVTSTKVKQVAEELVIDMQRTAKGAWVMGQSRVVGLVGDDFWFSLTQHPNVEKYYENWSAMASLKNLDPTMEFDFGGIIFKRYIGSDDNTEVAIATDQAKFFIQGGRDIFVKAMAPADEHMPYVNTLGQPLYTIPVEDFEFRNAPRYMGYEVRAYPLYICQRPNTLRTGTLT